MESLYQPGSNLSIPDSSAKDADAPLTMTEEQLLIRLALNPLGRKHSIYYPGMDVPRSFSALSELLNDLASALEEVCKNAFSYAIWRKSVPDFGSKSYLQEFRNFSPSKEMEIVAEAHPIMEVNAQRDLIEFAILLRRQSSSIRPPETFDEVMKIKRALLNMIEFHRSKERSDPGESLLDFLELGYELYPDGIPDKDFSEDELENAASFFQFNYGAAGLLDLVRCFPTTAELRSFLIKQYPNVFPSEISENALFALEGIDLQLMLPSFLREAKADIDSHNVENNHRRETDWLFGAMIPFDSPRRSPLLSRGRDDLE
jgi:hypothetical protein